MSGNTLASADFVGNLSCLTPLSSNSDTCPKIKTNIIYSGMFLFGVFVGYFLFVINGFVMYCLDVNVLLSLFYFICYIYYIYLVL